MKVKICFRQQVKSSFEKSPPVATEEAKEASGRI